MSFNESLRLAATRGRLYTESTVPDVLKPPPLQQSLDGPPAAGPIGGTPPGGDEMPPLRRQMSFNDLITTLGGRVGNLRQSRRY